MKSHKGMSMQCQVVLCAHKTAPTAGAVGAWCARLAPPAPAGEVTMSLRAPGCLPVSTTILAEPSTVCRQGVVPLWHSCSSMARQVMRRCGRLRRTCNKRQSMGPQEQRAVF